MFKQPKRRSGPQCAHWKRQQQQTRARDSSTHPQGLFFSCTATARFTCAAASPVHMRSRNHCVDMLMEIERVLGPRARQSPIALVAPCMRQTPTPLIPTTCGPRHGRATAYRDLSRRRSVVAGRRPHGVLRDCDASCHGEPCLRRPRNGRCRGASCATTHPAMPRRGRSSATTLCCGTCQDDPPTSTKSSRRLCPKPAPWQPATPRLPNDYYVGRSRAMPRRPATTSDGGGGPSGSGQCACHEA